MAHLNVASTDAAPRCDDYEWPTHQSNLRDVERLGLPPETGWAVSLACAADRPSDFDSVTRRLAEVKADATGRGRDPETTLPTRIAVVALWNLQRTDLDYPNRCGAAWAVIPTGMAGHRWRFRNDLSRVVIYRARLDFFDRYHEVEPLSELLDACFFNPDAVFFKRRARMRVVLDRKEADIIEREAKLRSLGSPSTDSLKHERMNPARGARKQR